MQLQAPNHQSTLLSVTRYGRGKAEAVQVPAANHQRTLFSVTRYGRGRQRRCRSRQRTTRVTLSSPSPGTVGEGRSDGADPGSEPPENPLLRHQVRSGKGKGGADPGSEPPENPLLRHQVRSGKAEAVQIPAANHQRTTRGPSSPSPGTVGGW